MQIQNSASSPNSLKEKKQNLIIAIVIGIGLIYLTSWFSNYLYFDELSIQITSKQTTLDSLENERKSLENTKQTLSVLEEKSLKLEEDYKKLSGLVPEEKELQDILKDLSDAGKLRNLRLSHFSQSQKIARQGALNQVPITVSVVGSDDDISRYLFELTRFKRIFSVDSVKFNEETNPEYAGNVSAEIKFSAFISAPVAQELREAVRAKTN